MNLCSSLGIKKRLNCAPQEPEPGTSIDDEHPVQRLQENPELNNFKALIYLHLHIVCKFF